MTQSLRRANFFARHSSASWNPVLDLSGAAHEITLRLHPGEQATWHPDVGVTSDLVGRVWQHKNDVVEGFTKKYRVHSLVWYEQHQTMESAILREKAIKAWKREWKFELIEKNNLEWRDLYADIAQG